LAGAKTPTGQTVLLKKVFLCKLDFFFFASRSLPGWPNDIVGFCPPSSFSLVVRRSILHAVIICRLRHLLLLSSASPLLPTATIIVCRRHVLPPQPSAPLYCLSAVSAHSPPSPSQSAAQSCMSALSTTVVIPYGCRPPSPYLRLPSLLP
jgi:hypothetical protein